MKKTVEVRLGDATVRLGGEQNGIPSILTPWRADKEHMLAYASAIQQFYAEDAVMSAGERDTVDSIKKTLMTGGWRP